MEERERCISTGRFIKVLSDGEAKRRRNLKIANYRKKNPEKVNKCIYKWRKNNPENIKAIARKYRQNNKEKIKIEVNEWRQKNREKEELTRRKYRKNNPEKVKAYEKKCKTKQVFELRNAYIRATLIRRGFTNEQIQHYPELIETKRLIIKTHRLCKTLQS